MRNKEYKYAAIATATNNNFRQNITRQYLLHPDGNDSKQSPPDLWSQSYYAPTYIKMSITI